jgi:large subunit ribosomal protein L5
MNNSIKKYDREIGMTGLKVTVVFARKGKRVGRKKIKKGRIPARQNISKEELINEIKEQLRIEEEENKL